MNVPTLYWHLQVRDEHDHRHGHRPDRCLRDLVFLQAPGGQVDVRRALRRRGTELTLVLLAERLQLTADRSRKNEKAVESPVIKP